MKLRRDTAQLFCGYVTDCPVLVSMLPVLFRLGLLGSQPRSGELDLEVQTTGPGEKWSKLPSPRQGSEDVRGQVRGVPLWAGTQVEESQHGG